MTDEARHLRQITQRLSLRAPQEKSLEILSDLVSNIEFTKDLDVQEALAAVQRLYPGVTDFERNFPSLCFAIATGVGKTRLMGAFISFLYLTGRSKNFFVLAPNTTIYDKLVADFSRQTSPKYVFRGISQFAQTPPIIVTGETWEEGRGVRGSDLFGNEAIINVFNVQKVLERGRIRTLRETIGESYFDYLAGLPDLVMLMDEAHRYRAAAGMNAVAELKPVLGLELTATPRSVGARSAPFKNVILHYSLGNAMADGFVKEPAVATRANFRRDDFDQDQLEQIMLEDGVHYHEHVRSELDLYARQTGAPRVHPFMLVVAQDTAHASRIKALIDSDGFFGGAYKGLSIEVHSRQTGEESDEAMARLVGLETDARTEIVIHVNKLKEGWDVTNLFTIVPLRASASDILTEQTLGRGLRLPYGVRTGVETVDTLTVIAHDRFDKVIGEARAEGSLVKVKALTIGPGGDVSNVPPQVVEIRSAVDVALTGRRSELDNADEQAPYLFDTPQKQQVATVALDFIERKYERALRGGSNELTREDVRQQIAADVRRAIQPQQVELEIDGGVNVDEIVGVVTASVAENSIDIPEIVVIPSREVNFWFEDFDLTGLETIRYQPISDQILIRTLRTDSQRELARAVKGPAEERVENYIVRHLIDHDQIDYETQADLLYKLSGQMVAHLRSYLSTDADVENVCLGHGKSIAVFVLQQMLGHYRETPADYRAKVVRSFRTLKPMAVAVADLTSVLDIRQQASPLAETRRRLFRGTRKSPYNFHKFQSDTERRFAVLLESDHGLDVIRWLKPGPGQFAIEYAAGKTYEPDFVVETADRKLIVEIKADNATADLVVQQKARAAEQWVKHANELASDLSAKKWDYLLVPESAISESTTLAGLRARYAMTV